MAAKSQTVKKESLRLLDGVLDENAYSLDAASESVWIDVVQKMDEAYADLVKSQVELEQKNSELEDAHFFMKSIQASMSDILIVTDLQGRVQQVNRALVKTTGFSKKQVLKLPFQSLFTDESMGALENLGERVRQRTVNDLDVTLKGVGGEVPVSLNCAPHKVKKGRYGGIVMVGRPIGDLKRAYEKLHDAHLEIKQTHQQLINAEKMASLGRLVAGVAHELNNPISFVFGNVFALQGYCVRINQYLGALHSGESLEHLQTLRSDLRIDYLLNDLSSLIEGTLEGAERVRDIVQELRQFSSNKSDELVEFNFSQVIRTAVQWVIKEGKDVIRQEMDLPERITLMGHPGQIHQVVMNLVQNAIDATRYCDTPLLQVHAWEEKGRAHLTIRDNGPGIKEEIINHLFEPFFTTKPVGQGTGLGLSISYGIVHKFGGQLTAENHPQGGALFLLELPNAQ